MSADSQNLRLPRREFLYGLGATLGTVALNSLLQIEARAARSAAGLGPLAPKPQHHPARAKACIYLFMEGGPSHIDTFDPKPQLAELHMQEFRRDEKFDSAMSGGKRYFVKSPFHFRRAGQSGLSMCENFRHLA